MPTFQTLTNQSWQDGSSSRTVVVPSGITSGDALFLAVVVRGTDVPSTPSGWTLLGDSTAGGTQSYHPVLYLYGKEAAGSETDFTLSKSDTTRGSLACFRVSGGDYAALVDAVTNNDAALAGVSPSVVSPEADSLLICGIGFFQPFASQYAPAAPSGMTGQVTAIETVNSMEVMVASQAAVAAGATGVKTWGQYNGTDEPLSSGFSIVIPAASAAATLSSPTSASVTQTGATIGATTDDNTGTLYGVVTTSASAPSATQIKAGQDHTGSAAAGSGSNASLSVGANTIAITGLTAATTYYYYLVQDNGADSNVVNGTFTTAVAAPTLTSPTAVSIGTTTVTPRVTTDTGNGTCYYVITPQAEGEPSNTQVEAGTNAADTTPVAAGSTVVSGTPPVVVTFSEVTGLTAGTAYRISYAHSGTPS